MWPRSPETIDTRLALGIYGAVALTGGIFVYLWPLDILPNAQFAEPTGGQAPFSFTRVMAALVIASGTLAAAGASKRAGSPHALSALALAHLVFGSLWLIQWTAVFDTVLPPIVGWAPIAIGLVLWYLSGAASTRHRVTRVIGQLDLKAAHPGMRQVDHSMMQLRSQYEAQIQQAARQEERTRLARDLHDAVKQQLFVIQTAAATAAARADTDRAGADEAIGQVRQAARQALSEMNALIEQLQTMPVENTGLVERLQRQAEALGFQTGADVKVEIGPMPPARALPPGTHEALFRGAQEAFANIGRHARASAVFVALTTRGPAVALTIRDDGAGFDPLLTSRGMGLDNMAARVVPIGGSFTLKSAPARGTVVDFSIPLVERAPSHYLLRATAWAVGAAAASWYVRTHDLQQHPLLLAAAVVATLATIRYGVAWIRLQLRGPATS